MKNAKIFLEKIGVEKEVIDNLFSEEPAEDFKVEEISKSYLDGIKEVKGEDPEMISKIRSEAKGEIMSKNEHKIVKAFGLTKEEVADKKFDEILDVIKQKNKEAGNDTANELQEKLLSANQKIKTFEDETIPKIRSEAADKIKMHRVKAEVNGAISGIETVVDNQVLIPVVQSHLDNNFKFEIAEDGSLEVRTKEGTAPLNKDGTKKIGLDGIVKEHISSLNLLKQSNAGTTPEELPKAKKAPEAPAGQKEKVYNLPFMKMAEDNTASTKGA